MTYEKALRELGKILSDVLYTRSVTHLMAVAYDFGYVEVPLEDQRRVLTIKHLPGTSYTGNKSRYELTAAYPE